MLLKLTSPFLLGFGGVIRLGQGLGVASSPLRPPTNACASCLSSLLLIKGQLLFLRGLPELSQGEVRVPSSGLLWHLPQACPGLFFPQGAGVQREIPSHPRRAVSTSGSSGVASLPHAAFSHNSPQCLWLEEQRKGEGSEAKMSRGLTSRLRENQT